MSSAVIGLGTYLPPRRVSNEELADRFDTSDEWISTRTGIRTRRWADTGVSTGDLAVAAGERAMKSANLAPGDVDALVLATTTPDHPCPATAPDVASRLGLGHIAAYDISAVCSGFLYALAAGHGQIASQQARRVLVIGAETYSTILNPADRTTGVIFGDGAGAVVLAAQEATDQAGVVLGVDLGSDGSQKQLIRIPAGGSRQRTMPGDVPEEDHYFTMEGKAVFRQAVTRMGGSATALLQRIGWSTDSVDHLVGHQANVRILKALADYLEIPTERAVINIDRVGNTSAASIPLALADAAEQGRLKPGDRILMTAFGGGLTWASVAITWPDITPA
ncbi:beta-ketoacyl-ACP synthase III [Streptomyces sp. WELS2]|uniref:beta-ketoacyl-ACP synthase III n=1 Tax=Streptomyces sp. WELS2 TaxID=2749435 RepID=UPI0015F0704E|nr:beta-ketoacyl-ACP synthase III [Streptomyces sp. WELS2]